MVVLENKLLHAWQNIIADEQSSYRFCKHVGFRSSANIAKSFRPVIYGGGTATNSS
jgi:hypothetical protein